MVPLYRTHVPRLYLGLALATPQLPQSTLLIDTGGLAQTDRIGLPNRTSHPENFDNFVKDWLHHAYEAGPPPQMAEAK
jgi:hypothetical protein